MGRWRIFAVAACCVIAFTLIGAGVAGAATPVQLPGTAGCVALKGEGGCAAGRAIAAAERPAAVSPDGRNVYLVGQSNPEALEGDAIDVFDRDPTSGALTQKAGAEGCIAASRRDGCGRYKALNGAHEAAVSPDGRNVYVTTGAGIVVFARDATSGALTPQASPTECLGNKRLRTPCKPSQGIAGANSLAFSPDGTELYVSSNAYPTIGVLRRDPLTGALRPRGCVRSAPGPSKCGGEPTGEGATDAIVASPDGRSVYTVAVDIGYSSVFTRVDSFARKANGELHRTGGRTGCLHPPGPKGCPGGRGMRQIEGLVLSPDGHSLYVTSAFGSAGKAGAVTIFRRAANGKLSQAAGKDGCVSANGGECVADKALAGANAVAVSGDGTSVYATGLYGLAILDRSESGALTAPAGTAACLSDFKPTLCTAARGLEAASAVTVSPDSKSVYVTSFEPGGLAVFGR
jgi:DNA-binding beta-propeller fold protein YncE